MSTDREALAGLLNVVDAHVQAHGRSHSPELAGAADGVRRHLLLVESPDGDCRQRIEQASSAAYAAGRAAGADARPNHRQGSS